MWNDKLQFQWSHIVNAAVSSNTIMWWREIVFYSVFYDHEMRLCYRAASVQLAALLVYLIKYLLICFFRLLVYQWSPRAQVAFSITPVSQNQQPTSEHWRKEIVAKKIINKSTILWFWRCMKIWRRTKERLSMNSVIFWKSQNNFSMVSGICRSTGTSSGRHILDEHLIFTQNCGSFSSNTDRY